jgi:3',5'-cyclic AMP phosphodiesterase CpdA
MERTTLSTDPEWQKSLQQIASRQAERLGPGDWDTILDEKSVANVLDPLREYFTGHQIYALLVPSADGGESESLLIEELFKQFVFESELTILVLLPQSVESSINIVDPFPALASLANRAMAAPVAIFWTREETAFALPLSKAKDFFVRYIGSGNFSSDELNKLFRAEDKKNPPKRILHLSDLHFGDPQANRRKNYLKNHIAVVAQDADRVVISGDFFDTPDADLRSIFDEFRSDLQEWTKKTPILVPGNHDVRTKGNAIKRWGRNAEHVVDIGIEPIVIDDELRSIFYCFNSCDGGDFATGRVGEGQRLDRASRFEQLARKRQELRSFSKIAIVHHHPYSYDTAPTTTYEKILSYLYKNPERFVAFENARDFVNWCGVRGVSLILHGHKHVPHNVMATFEVRDQTKELMVVGCGSTTGVENKPMCYNIINLDPQSGRWSVSFFHDPDGDGSGFTLQNVTLDLRSELPVGD